MDQIRPWLFIGNYRNTLDLSSLRAHQIGAMLQLSEAVSQPGIHSIYLMLDDGLPVPRHLLRQGVDYVLAQKQKGVNTLIACGAGMSRASIFAAAVLKESEGLSLLDAIVDIKRHHFDAMPHPVPWASLCSFYREDIPFIYMLKAISSRA